MKLVHLVVHNFRSVRHVEMDVAEMVILLGPNNHGKSNMLLAIEFGLSTSAKVDESDFFSFRDDEDALWVEMTFNFLTEQECTTFQKYILQDGTLRVRKTAHLDDSGRIEISYAGYFDEPEEWWLRASGLERLSTREKAQNESAAVPQLQDLLEVGGRITQQRLQDFQLQYVQDHRDELAFNVSLEDGPLLGTRNVAGGVLPDFFLVPAVRDMTERDPEFLRLKERLQDLLSELNARPDVPPEDASELARLEAALADELTSWGVGVSIEVTPPELEKVFEIGTQLHLDDGLKTLAEKKGHGLQRAVLFALLRAWAKVLRTTPHEGAPRARLASDSVFFAIEEPELFLHPHGQRQIFELLEKISEVHNHQIFICTHSTHFVDLEHYRRIAVVTKESPQDGTTVRQCMEELFAGENAADRKRRFHMAAWVNPDRGEMMFAQKVVLVEGETEKAALPFLARKIDCFDDNVSVVDCGSKHNLPLYIAILNAFSIPYCIVHDEDPLPDPIPDEWTPDKVGSKRRTFALNETIAASVVANLGAVEVFAGDFEAVSGISHNQADRKGKALAALDHFSAMSVPALPARVVEVVRSVFRVAVEAQQ